MHLTCSVATFRSNDSCNNLEFYVAPLSDTNRTLCLYSKHNIDLITEF